jgi:hypothetical protein
VRLLAQKYAIVNWDAYVAANNISGWVDDNSVPVCLWSGVTCNPDGRIQTLALQCPACPLKAEGTVASNLSAIMPMTTVNLQQQNLSGTLPPSFGGDGAFPSLINLLLSQNRLSGGAQQLLFLHCCMSRCRTGPGRRGWTCPAGCFSFMSRRHRASSLGRPRLLPQPGAPHPVWQQPDGPAAGA